MSEQTTTTTPIAPDVRPRLPHGVRLVHSEAQGGWVLLAPERARVTSQGWEVAEDGQEIVL